MPRIVEDAVHADFNTLEHLAFGPAEAGEKLVHVAGVVELEGVGAVEDGEALGTDLLVRASDARLLDAIGLVLHLDGLLFHESVAVDAVP